MLVMAYALAFSSGWNFQLFKILPQIIYFPYWFGVVIEQHCGEVMGKGAFLFAIFVELQIIPLLVFVILRPSKTRQAKQNASGLDS